MLAVALLVFNLLKVACLENTPAKQLMTYDYRREKFILDDDVLRELQALQGPVRIISVIGEARVGKSTNLNLIRYFLDGNKTGGVRGVFKTSENAEPCTSGVWMSLLRDTTNVRNTILIDTEGTNMGHNEVTDLFSIFAVLVSSGVALFTREIVSNYNIEFLYRVSRLSEQIWEQDLQNSISYPRLMVVIRDALSPSPGKTLQSEIQDMILNDKSRLGKTIERIFPRDRILVRNIPFVQDSKRFTDLRDEYANIASSLATDFKRFPCKKTASGGVVDGKMIADLAIKIQTAINRNSWKAFTNTYVALETHLCDRKFKEIIEPLLEKDVEEIKHSIDRAMGQFVENCALEDEINLSRDRVANVIALKDEIREKQERVDQEKQLLQMEERREREREEELRLKVREQEKRLKEERRARKMAEERKNILEQQAKRLEEMTIAASKRKRDRKKRDIFRSFLGGAALFAVFSDSRLKENITALPHSRFEEIGLQGYSWVWSRKAAEQLGKRGEDSGVIAQEVENLYPWAVVTGIDGYKRVNYAALEQLVLLKKKEIGL